MGIKGSQGFKKVGLLPKPVNFRCSFILIIQLLGLYYCLRILDSQGQPNKVTNMVLDFWLSISQHSKSLSRICSTRIISLIQTGRNTIKLVRSCFCWSGDILNL